jgi:hypothetical protein
MKTPFFFCTIWKFCLLFLPGNKSARLRIFLMTKFFFYFIIKTFGKAFWGQSMKQMNFFRWVLFFSSHFFHPASCSTRRCFMVNYHAEDNGGKTNKAGNTTAALHHRPKAVWTPLLIRYRRRWLLAVYRFQSGGKIFIGGDFSTYNGVPRNRIARIK